MRSALRCDDAGMLLPIHVLAGALAIVFGFSALFVRKGGSVHRRIGRWFVYAMVMMGATASVLEFLHGTSVTNLIAALLAIYFVGTAWTAVRAPSRWTRAIDVAALLVALLLALAAVIGGVTKITDPGLSPGGVPLRTVGAMSFVLAAALLLAAAGDVRVLRSGLPQGGARLARHLWRMCFALFMAAGSFFSIRERVAKVLPEPFTTGAMRTLPIVVLFGVMTYWLWRVRAPRAGGVTMRQTRSLYVAAIVKPAAKTASRPGETVGIV